MPQLNPEPWMAILVYSWLVLMVMMPPKVLAHIFPNEPAPLSVKASYAQSWTWPWV
nr:ATP synthase F0 subunit 8 [Heteropriacanthus cruentatus]